MLKVTSEGVLTTWPNPVAVGRQRRRVGDSFINLSRPLAYQWIGVDVVLNHNNVQLRAYKQLN
jgi:hypothetical protein